MLFGFPFAWGDSIFILETFQNLTAHGPEQPAAADSALGRSNRPDCLQTCLVLMLTSSSSVMMKFSKNPLEVSACSLQQCFLLYYYYTHTQKSNLRQLPSLVLELGQLSSLKGSKKMAVSGEGEREIAIDEFFKKIFFGGAWFWAEQPSHTVEENSESTFPHTVEPSALSLCTFPTGNRLCFPSWFKDASEPDGLG